MTATEGQALTFGSLPVVEEPPAQPGVSDVGESGPSIPGQAMSADIAPLGDSSVPFKEEADDVTAALYAIPELASLGRVFRSSSPVPLTENETEYVVQCVKHVFEDHLVLDFSIHNTIEDQRLTDVVVALDSGGENEIYTLIGRWVVVLYNSTVLMCCDLYILMYAKKFTPLECVLFSAFLSPC